MNQRLGRIRLFVRTNEGSVTLEAAMVFPWVLIVTFLLIFFSLILSERVLNFYSAAVTGERAAFNWSNSAKELRTGAYPSGRYDNLYWRLSDDSLLAGLFGWTTKGDGAAVPISPGSSHDGSTPENKLLKAGAAMPHGTKGNVAYRNRLWLREISIESAGVESPLPLLRIRGGETEGAFSAYVKAVVVEPAEIIRSFDLIRYYKAKLSKQGQGAAGYRAKAAAVLENKR